MLDETFFVLYGDSYLRVDAAAVADRFEESGAEALMTVYRNDGRWEASNAVFDGHRVVRYDKHEPDPTAAGMHHIDYGLSVLRAESVRERLPGSGPSDLADMMQIDQPRRPARRIRSRVTASSRSVHRPAWPTCRTTSHLTLKITAEDRPVTTSTAPVTADPNVRLLVPADDVDDPELSIVIPALNEQLTVSRLRGLVQGGARGRRAWSARS